MNKPISTWTQTFYKLGYTLRRVWHDEPDYANNYTPLALEVLEDRQMLSGFGGDDPLGGGTGDTGGTGGDAGEFSGGTPSPPSGDGTDGNGAASPAAPGGNPSPDRFNGIGDFSNGLQLPDYWQSVLPANYSFVSNDKINFRGTVANGVYTFSNRTDNTSPDDDGVVTLSHYEFTVTVSRQNGNYDETLAGQMTRYTLTSLDIAARDGFKNGSNYDFSSKGRITFTSNINYAFTQNFSGTMLTGVTANVTENTDTLFNWTAEEHQHIGIPSAEYSVTSDATFELTGATHGYDHATFQATVTPSLVTFQASGNGYQRSGARGTTYADASGTPGESSWITTTVSGTTTVEVGNLNGQAEGHRLSTTMDGTVKNAFSNNYNFNGSGKILSVTSSTPGHNGWVTDATINKTQNTSSRFKNDLTTDFESERFIINAAVLTGLAQTTSGQQGIAGQFIVNLGDDASVRNTNRETTTVHSTNNNTGRSSGQSSRTLRYKPDGTIVSSVQQPDSLTQHIDVDRYDESTHVVDVYVYAANGFTHDRYDTEQDSTATGTIDLTMTDDVTYTTNQVGYTGEHNLVGKQTTTGRRDLTMETNATSIHNHHQEHLMYLTGSLVEVRRSGTSGSSNSDSGTGGGSNVTGPGDSNPNNPGSGADDELPPPGSSAIFNFTDKRIEVTNVTLRTVSNEDSQLNNANQYFADGSIRITDNTVIDTETEFRPGSQATINKERWHTPMAGSDPNNQNSGYNHNYELRTFAGFSKGKLTNDLTWMLTPIVPEDNTESSTNDEGLTASAVGITGAAPGSEKFTVSMTGTETLWNEETLSITSIEHGSQWLDQLTIAAGTKSTIYASGNWSGSGTTNDYGNSTTTTEYFADKHVKVTNAGNSRHDHTSNKTLTTTSHRGVSSGDIPPGYPDPHSRSDMTVAYAMDLKDAWAISIDSGGPSGNLGDIEDARDSVSGTFRIQRDFETVTQQIHASETGSTDYNFTTTYTPKPPSANNGDDANLLAEPSVGTGTDAAGAFKNMWNLFDIKMDGTLTERSDVTANTSSDDKLVIKFKFDQQEGNHTTELPSDWVVASGNYLLPEFLNRNEVRSFGLEINDYETNRTVVRTIDNKETTFAEDGTVTRKTLANAAPSGGTGSGGAGTGGANQMPGGALSGNDDFLYHDYLNESKIKRSKFDQEAVWMDSISAGHGYFSLDTSSTTPDSGPSSSNLESLRIKRNLTVVESLGSYFGIDAAGESGSAGGASGGTSGSSSGGTSGTSSPPPGTSAPPSGDSSGSSTYLPATGDGSMTGHFEMTTKDESKSHYQWKQTNFSRFANVTFSHVQKDVTKVGNKAINHETNESEYSAEFKAGGKTSYSTKKTKATSSEWDNFTMGGSIVDYRIGGSTEVDFHSNFNGTHSSTTIDREGDTGESIHDNVGKTMTSESSATASANGFSSQTTTENYLGLPTPLLYDPVIKQVTTETINEVVAGTHSSNINLFDMSGDGNTYSDGIKLTRTPGMTTELNFRMRSPETQTSPSVPETKHWGASFQVSQLKTFAYGSADDPQEYSSIVKTLWTRVWGTVKLLFGIAEVVAGVAAVKTGIGAPFGVLAIIHGLDTMYAGATQLVSGDEQQTLTKRLANSAFLAHFKPATLEEKKELEKFGEGIDSLVGIVGGLGGAGALFKGAKQLKQGAGVAKAAGGVDDVAKGVGQNIRKAANKCIDDGHCFTADTGVAGFTLTEDLLAAAHYQNRVLQPTSDRSLDWMVVGLGIVAATTMLVARPRKYDESEQDVLDLPALAM